MSIKTDLTGSRFKSFQWQAIDDSGNFEQIGYGETEQEAIDDLLERAGVSI